MLGFEVPLGLSLTTLSAFRKCICMCVTTLKHLKKTYPRFGSILGPILLMVPVYLPALLCPTCTHLLSLCIHKTVSAVYSTSNGQLSNPRQFIFIYTQTSVNATLFRLCRYAHTRPPQKYALKPILRISFSCPFCRGLGITLPEEYG